MKKIVLSIGIYLLSLYIYIACDKETQDNTPTPAPTGTGYVTFGHGVQPFKCVIDTKIYIDNETVGLIPETSNKISDCFEQTNLTKELANGIHHYKIEMISQSTCVETLEGVFSISEKDCNKIYLVYNQLYNVQADEAESIIRDTNLYDNMTDHSSMITNALIVKDYLFITYSASGCDPDEWDAKLIDSGIILEPYPSQQTLKFSLENNQACQSVFQKTVVYNLFDLQQYGTSTIQLNIGDFSLIYNYTTPIN